jgi:hypothetical protein
MTIPPATIAQTSGDGLTYGEQPATLFEGTESLTLLQAGKPVLSPVSKFKELDIIGFIHGANMNATGDTQFTMKDWISGQYYVVDTVLCTNASTSLTTAVAGVFTATSAGGQTLFPSSALAALTTSKAYTTTSAAATLASASGGAPIDGAGHGTAVNNAPYLHVGTAQGAAATADWFIYGRILPT